jgi:hypothetical protein
MREEQEAADATEAEEDAGELTRQAEEKETAVGEVVVATEFFDSETVACDDAFETEDAEDELGFDFVVPILSTQPSRNLMRMVIIQASP